jgi:hypothetical protein
LSKTGYEEEASSAILKKKKQMADYDFYAFNIKKSIGLVQGLDLFQMGLAICLHASGLFCLLFF